MGGVKSTIAQLIGQLIGDTWRRAIKERAAKVGVDRKPDALRDLLDQYRKKPSQPYDFANDILDETIWLEQGREFANQYSLSLPGVDAENVEQVVKQSCEHFRLCLTSRFYAVFRYCRIMPSLSIPK